MDTQTVRALVRREIDRILIPLRLLRLEAEGKSLPAKMAEDLAARLGRRLGQGLRAAPPAPSTSMPCGCVPIEGATVAWRCRHGRAANVRPAGS